MAAWLRVCGSDLVSGADAPVDRVVVVGAGIAGLAAAAHLHSAGVRCVVLEARDRLGGRMHTVDLSGVPVDLGASWIHHPIGNPLSALFDHHGLARDAGNPIPTLTAYDERERRRLDHAETEALLDLVVGGFGEAIGSLQKRLPPNATAVHAIETFIEERRLSGAEARRARQALLAEIEADAGDRADNRALAGLGDEETYAGDLFGDLPRAGYRSVVEALAAPLDVRVNSEVVSVEVMGDAVAVTCADGSVQSGTHAIVAVPLGVLKSGRPQFHPPLPQSVQAAIAGIGFGRYEKIALRFDPAFWRDDLSHLLVFRSDDAEPAMWLFDLDAFGAGPVLCAHLFHSLTPYVLDRTPIDAVRWLTDLLSEVFGHAVPAPIATAVTSWAHDRFACGAYSHGADPAMFDVLGQPIWGRLILAGEHTSRDRTGYADGAYTSGLRAARALATAAAGECSA